MNNIICNVDTDSLMIAKPDGSPWSKEEQDLFLKQLNEQFPELINWEHDGIFSSVVVIKSKNYALLPEGTDKIKTKGSSIRDQKKEPALREMMDKMIHAMIYNQQDELVFIYESYIKEAILVKDIMRWSQKKTITESVTNCEFGEGRKNEMDVWNSIKNEDDKQPGNKIYVYPVILGTEIIPGKVSEKTGKPLKDKVNEITGLKLAKNWSNDHDVDKLLDRVYATLSIFKSVIDIQQFTDYTKKSNKELLNQLKKDIF